MQMIDRSQLYPLLFEPIYKEIVWGGEMLETHLHRHLPDTPGPIAESWEIADREDGVSVIQNGALNGVSIRELLEMHGKSVVGTRYNGGRFPLLIKIIDAGQRLSLQVHPDEAACLEIGNGAEPKTEMWYVIAARDDAKIIAGLKSNTTKRHFVDRLSSPEIEDCLQVFKSSPGDAYFITSGRIHSIGAGNLLLEIQQNSNTTYRVSDWGRVGLDGQPRELHVEQAMACIDFRDRTSPRITGVSDFVDHNRKFPIIKHCPFFRVSDLRLVESWQDNTETTQSFHLITAVNNPVVVGNETFSAEVEAGRNCLIPACFGQYTIEVPENAQTTVVKTTL